jgi:hypothetical protein
VPCLKFRYPQPTPQGPRFPAWIQPQPSLSAPSPLPAAPCRRAPQRCLPCPCPWGQRHHWCASRAQTPAAPHTDSDKRRQTKDSDRQIARQGTYGFGTGPMAVKIKCDARPAATAMAAGGRHVGTCLNCLPAPAGPAWGYRAWQIHTTCTAEPHIQQHYWHQDAVCAPASDTCVAYLAQHEAAVEQQCLACTVVALACLAARQLGHHCIQ